MNPILYVLYHILKVIVLASLRAFYPRTTIHNRDKLRFPGPAIVISNHPNTLLDAMHVAARTREPLFFLANASLFRGWFQNWFFNTMYCIPVVRPKDVKSGPVRNLENFARCFDHFDGEGNIWIAPEGGSEMERRLRPFRTGTARIAFGAEARRDFDLDLKIIPVGLTYEAPNRFGSRVFINAGDPIYVRDFRESYESNPTLAIRWVTAHLETTVRELLIDTRDEAEDQLIRQLEELLRNSRPVSEPEHFRRTKKLIETLRQREQESPQENEAFRQEVAAYAERLAELSVDDRTVVKGPPSAGYLLGLLAGLPLFLYGVLNNALPALIPRELARRIDLYIGYHATLKTVVGLITFPLFYWLQSKLVGAWLGTPAAWIYLLSLIPAGYFAWWYARRWREVRRRWSLNRTDREQLLERRRQVWKELIGLIG